MQQLLELDPGAGRRVRRVELALPREQQLVKVQSMRDSQVKVRLPAAVHLLDDDLLESPDGTKNLLSKSGVALFHFAPTVSEPVANFVIVDGEVQDPGPDDRWACFVAVDDFFRADAGNWWDAVELHLQSYPKFD